MLFDRTLHPDEANQAFTTGRLLETGTYTYQPQDHHGPTLYYAAAAMQRAAGRGDTASLDETILRCTPLVFAVLAIVLGAAALKRLSGRILPGILLTALLGTAPMFAFFATDFIQEMLLVCFLTMMFWAGTGFLNPGRKWKTGTWALMFGTATGLAFATKETCLLSFAAATVAALPLVAEHGAMNKLRTRLHIRDAVFAAGGFVIISLILYSDFGRDFGGVYNAFVAAPLSYLHRGVGDASTSTGANWHVHPWWWYGSLLFGGGSVYSLSAIALAALAAACSLPRGAGRAARFVFFYAIALFAIHSAIPYKTPWCMLPVVSALALSAALGLPGLKNRNRLIFPFAAFLALVTLDLQINAFIKMNRDPDATDIPYNYAAASPDAKELAAIVDSAIENSGDGNALAAVALPSVDTWPLPWYNRKNGTHTGYWNAFEDLKRLAADGIKPVTVVVPMEEGHLVQPLFPHLKNTKRLYMRPRIPERNVRGVRVRVFWQDAPRKRADQEIML